MTDPNIGELVHYVSKLAPNSEEFTCRPAIVNQVPGVWENTISITAFTPYETVINWSCYNNEIEHVQGTWHWPEGAPSGV